VDVGPGLPGFVLVGLPDAAIREARDRVWPALRHAGFQVPDRRVTVNLAPADRRKEGASMDLAVVLGVLSATGQAPAASLPYRFGSACRATPRAQRKPTLKSTQFVGSAIR